MKTGRKANYSVADEVVSASINISLPTKSTQTRIVVIGFLGKTLETVSLTKGTWLFWVSNYRLDEIETSRSASPVASYACELDNVQPDAEPTLDIGAKFACVTAITSREAIECFGIDYAVRSFQPPAPGPRVIEPLAPSNRIRWRRFLLSPDALSSLCSVWLRSPDLDGRGQSEYLVGLPRDAQMLLPTKLTVRRNDEWILKPRNAIIDEIEKGLETNIHTGRNDSRLNTPNMQAHLEPKSLCESCSLALRHSRLLREMQTEQGDGKELTSLGKLSIHAVPKEIGTRDRPTPAPTQPSGTGEEGRTNTSRSSNRRCDNFVELTAELDAMFASEQYEHHTHHRSLQDLSEAVLRGCHLCAKFRANLGRNVKGEVDSMMQRAAGKALYSVTSEGGSFQGYPRFDPLTEPSSSEKDCQLKVPMDQAWCKPPQIDGQIYLRISVNSLKAQLCLYQPADKGQNAWKTAFDVQRLPPGRETECVEIPKYGRFTSSPETIHLAKYWLSDCLHYHNCAFPHYQSKPPTRLIDVSPFGEDPNTLRLNITPKDSGGVPYLALSHCWGKTQPLRLLSNTMDRLLKGFELATLPATFRDAVYICRALGLRYLWIDSLCIVQDDDDDWKREAAAMADVYSNAVCTIAARSATGVDSGCFLPRNTLQEVPLIWSYSDAMHLSAPSVPETRFNLDTRGWVFQERLLSPRILTFSSAGISWGCRETVADELNRFGRPRKPLSRKYKMDEALVQVTRANLTPLPTGGESFMSGWFDLVEDYVGLQFTKSRDRLVAIAGIATKISRTTGLDYYYGLWHDVHRPQLLLAQLLWRTTIPGRPVRLAFSGKVADTAPSFSWAIGFDRRIEYPIAFHHRPTDRSSASATRSTFVGREIKIDELEQGDLAQQEDSFAELNVRHRNARVTTRTCRLEDVFGKSDLSFPTRVEQLSSPSDMTDTNGGFVPMIVLKGPIRHLRLRSRDGHGPMSQWDYPWPQAEGDTVVGTEDETDERRCEWFFPDGVAACKFWVKPQEPLFHWTGQEVSCLTIAKWRRSWDDRWYTAGLVLSKVPIAGGRTQSGREIMSMMRVGYFEHSWPDRHRDWENHGSDEIVLLV